MPKSVVAVLKTKPATVLDDYHRLMNLAGYQEVVDKNVDTALKINISWHFFFPGSSTVPWQLEGVIRAMKQDGYDPNLIHACHNRTVVIDARLGERENKQLDVVQAHGLRNVHLYEGEEWV
ncbi:MAG: iron-sulfur cluster-binding protein, partial [Labilithrix sp.]|nr:iron-sulfur cluster-binding protein [Labilithrix sp.]